MKFFAAGSHTRKYMELCNQYDCHKLWSILREKTEFLKWPAVRWTMLDSGAHSWNKLVTSHIQSENLPAIEDHANFYIDFVNGCEKTEAVFVELDVFKIYTIEQLDELYARFTNPHVIRVYHPELDNHSLDIVKKWIYDDGHKYIGVANDGTHLLDAIFNLTRDKIMVHGFAMTKPELLKRYPFYSVDSTTPLATVQYGHVVVPQDGVNTKRFLIDKQQALKQQRFGVNQERLDRLEAAIKEFKRIENFFDELWTTRGIKWPEHPWEAL